MRARTQRSLLVAALAALLIAVAWWALGRQSLPTPDPGAAGTETRAEAPALPPILRGLGAPRAPAPEASPPASATAPPSIPLDAPIPEGEGSLAGRIRFADGTPFAHERIRLGVDGGVTETDEEGRFHIHGERMVGLRGLLALGSNDYFLGLATVRLRVNQRVTVEVTIERGYALEGRVVDAATNAPVAAARVGLSRSEPFAQAWNGGGKVDPDERGRPLAQAWNGGVKTDADGRFRFDLLPAATYTLSVAAPGYLTFVWTGEVRSAPAALDVRLGASMPLTLKYVDAPAAAVGTSVRWTFMGNGFNQEGRGALVEGGEVRGDAPPAGAYLLTAYSNDILPFFQQQVTVRGGEGVTVTFQVPASRDIAGRLRDAAGRPMGNVRVRIADLPAVPTGPGGDFLARGVTFGKKPVSIMFDGGSVRIGWVEVTAERTTEFDWRAPAAVGEVSATIPGAVHVAVYETRGNERKVAEAKPDRTGRIRIPYLAAGSYRLHAFGGGSVDDQERAFDLLPGQSLDLGEIDLSRHPVLPVAVTFPPQAKRPSFLLVMILREPGEPPMLSGRIEFDGEEKAWLKGVPAGEWKVAIEAQGFVPLETTIVVRDGVTTPIPIELRAK